MVPVHLGVWGRRLLESFCIETATLIFLEIKGNYDSLLLRANSTLLNRTAVLGGSVVD